MGVSEIAKGYALAPALIGFVASPSVRRRADSLFALLQQVDPVHRSPIGIVVVSRHADVVAALRNPDLGSDERRADPSRLRVGALSSLLGRGHAGDTERAAFLQLHDHLMLFKDPPDHQRLRSLVQSAFTPSRIAAVEPRVAAIVDELLDRMIDAGTCEFMRDFAYPLPARVICELLGVPADDHQLFATHAPALAASLDPSPMRTKATVDRANAAVSELCLYLDGLIAERRARQSSDLLSALVTAEERGAKLTHDELVATILLLVLAGHETTANVLGNSLTRLLRGGRELWRLADLDDDSMGRAVEETLRLDGPVQMLERIALRDVQIGGHRVVAGTIVVLLPRAANLDPQTFRNPTQMDVRRDPNPHVAFGGGRHFCLGAALARLELRVALRGLSTRLPGCTALIRSVARDSFTLRGPAELHLAL